MQRPWRVYGVPSSPVRITDLRGVVKRYEDSQGRKLAEMIDGKLQITELGELMDYKVTRDGENIVRVVR